jgi:hypothetical protein
VFLFRANTIVVVARLDTSISQHRALCWSDNQREEGERGEDVPLIGCRYRRFGKMRRIGTCGRERKGMGPRRLDSWT